MSLLLVQEGWSPNESVTQLTAGAVAFTRGEEQHHQHTHSRIRRHFFGHVQILLPKDIHVQLAQANHSNTAVQSLLPGGS